MFKRKFVLPILFFIAFLFLGSRVLQPVDAPTQPVTAQDSQEEVLPEKTIDFSPLKSSLENQIAVYKGEVSFALIDLKSGEAIAIKPQEIFYPASAIKIVALISTLRDVQEGEYDLESVEPNIKNMMMYSSNTATNFLINKTGFEGLNKEIRDASLFNTTFIHGLSDGNTDVPRARIGANAMTAGDAVVLWQKLFQGKLLNKEYTEKALEYAKTPNVNLIFAGEGASVYHKPGYIGTLSAETYIDAGVVETEKFAYSIAYFSRKNPTHQQGADFADQLTREVYTWFSENY